jgi:hypothetical protein
LIAKFFRPSSQAFDVLLPVSFFEVRQKKSWVDSGSGNLPSE